MNDGLDGLALRLAVVKYLMDSLAAARKEDLVPQAAEAMPPGSRIPVMLGGKRAAFVQMPKPYTKAEVTHPARFLAWCEQHAATEVETVRQPRPSFVQLLLKEVKERGGWLDRTTGELLEVPGITVTEGEPSPRVELAGDAEAVFAEAWRGGDIDLRSYLALPAGKEAV